MQAGEPYLAVQVFKDLQRSGMRPNCVTYCGVISALCKQRRRGLPSAELAYELWLELQQQGLPLDAAAYRTGGVSRCQLLFVWFGRSMYKCISACSLYAARWLVKTKKRLLDWC